MKNAILLHGYADNPNVVWFPYIKKILEQKGFKVWAPQLPGNPTPALKDHLPFVLKNGTFNSETVIIAHSAGCPLTLSVLENLNEPIAKAILVAGFVTPLTVSSEPNAILQPSYNWQKIKANVKDIIFINSDNDPWGCDEKQGRVMSENLGGRQITLHAQGHFGSATFNQKYDEFPLLANLV